MRSKRPFNAVQIEQAFVYFFDKQISILGGPFNAEVFIVGNFKELGTLLILAADYFTQRLNLVMFSIEERKAGGAAARLRVYIDKIADLGKEMSKRSKRVPEDLHWEIIGCLLGAIGALLNHIDGDGGPR